MIKNFSCFNLIIAFLIFYSGYKLVMKLTALSRLFYEFEK